MVDFGNYKKLREDGSATREFVFEDIQGQPSVISRPATEANAPYNNARLKSIDKRTRGGRKKVRLNPGTVSASRREDAMLFARFCVTGWGKPPVDVEGREVDFSPENCRDFFLAIPEEFFDDYRAWAQDGRNFADDDLDELDDPESEDEPLDMGESPNASPSESGGNADTSATAGQ